MKLKNYAHFLSPPSYGRGFMAILILAAALRLMGLSKGIWLDEASSIDLITRTDFLAGLRNYDHPPLYFAMLRLWATINAGEPFLRLLSVGLSLGMVITVMRWLRRYSDVASLLGGFLCATMPVMLEYAHEIRNYALLLWGTALAFYFAERILRQPDRWLGYIGLTVSLTVVVTTHLVGVLLLPAVGVFMGAYSITQARPFQIPRKLRNFAQGGSVTRRSWTGSGRFTERSYTTRNPYNNSEPGKISGISNVGQYNLSASQNKPWTPLRRLVPVFALPTIAFLYLFFVFLPNHLQQRTVDSWWMPSASIPQVLKTFKYLSGLPSLFGDISVSNAVFTPLGFGLLAISLIVFAPLLLGDWRQSTPMLVTALTYWAGLLFMSMALAPVFIARTALPGLIPLIGFISVQIATIPTWTPQLAADIPGLSRGLRWLPLAGLLLINLVTIPAWVRHDAWTPVERWQPIAETLAQYRQPDDLVVFYPGYNEAPTRYYYPADLPPESVVTIWIGGTSKKLDFLRQLVAKIAAQERPAAVYLVLRDDQNVANEAPIYAEMSDLLESTFGPPTELVREGNLQVWQYHR
jgi:hypothetical protein